MMSMNRNIPTSERLIVALDVDKKAQAIDIVSELGETVKFYKVGLQLFLGCGMEVVTELTSLGKKVFLDLKIDDTPRTVERAVENMAKDGVQFFTLQGNGDTARAARAGRGDREFPKFLQVTYLSSWDTEDLRDHFFIPGSRPVDLDDKVVHRARQILNSGCEGVIASGSSVKKLRSEYPSILIVTPGIRPEGTKSDDHKRTLTPYEAILSGADYLVVGRPIRDSKDKVSMAQKIQKDVERAFNNMKSVGSFAGYNGAKLAHAVAY